MPSQEQGFLGLRLSKHSPYSVEEVDDLTDEHGLAQGSLGYSNEAVQPGDILHAIDGQDTSHMSLADIHSLLKGHLHTTVQLVFRRGEDRLKVKVMRHRFHEFDRNSSEIAPREPMRQDEAEAEAAAPSHPDRYPMVSSEQVTDAEPREGAGAMSTSASAWMMMGMDGGDGGAKGSQPHKGPPIVGVKEDGSPDSRTEPSVTRRQGDPSGSGPSKSQHALPPYASPSQTASAAKSSMGSNTPARSRSPSEKNQILTLA